MINTLEVYRDCGSKAAKAMNQRDQGRATFEHTWFNRARRLETEDDRREADKAFREGYTTERSFLTVD